MGGMTSHRNSTKLWRNTERCVKGKEEERGREGANCLCSNIVICMYCILLVLTYISSLPPSLLPPPSLPPPSSLLPPPSLLLSGILCSPPPASTGGHCVSSPCHIRPRPAHQLRPHGRQRRLPYHVTRETLGVLLPPQGQVLHHGDAV